MKNSKKIKLLLATLFLSAAGVFAQENFFGDIGVTKNLTSSTEWNQSVYGHFKHFFSEDGWYRFGASYTLTRNVKNWGIQAGLLTERTFDDSIDNYWEIRPWVGLTLSNDISSKLKFQQFFKFEWRNLLFAGDLENQSTTRTRYKIMPVYDVGNNWSVYTSYEWYIQPNTDLGARFINSREWNLGFNKKMEKFTLNFNYTRERFNEVVLSDATKGNTFSITFIF
ncbi:DUF2490 domain-containing protein [Allomuricauda sp. NBRC 101325]|uniref:DUF2490 domain-containing protein n=1 Tax=Allomuricauda sp. NBRC 101325 TaxID=1113758 RepID=UPI002556BBB5|nr:DUF2490 domain-containing protein [Muricauda sp. NBRC 101325]